MQPNIRRTQTSHGKLLQEHQLTLVGYNKKTVAIPAVEIDEYGVGRNDLGIEPQ